MRAYDTKKNIVHTSTQFITSHCQIENNESPKRFQSLRNTDVTIRYCKNAIVYNIKERICSQRK